MQSPGDPSARAGPDSIVAFLRTVALFAAADTEALDGLAQRSNVRKVSKDAIVFDVGDRASAVYVVRAGEVAEFAPAPSGLHLPVKVRRSGDFFGEIGIVTSGAHVVREVARTDATLVVIPAHEFMALVRECPDVALAVIDVLARRLIQAGSRVVALARMNAEGQVADYLLWLDEEEGNRGSVTTSQEAIADACGLARQTVARIIGGWRAAGLVTTGRGELRLSGRDELRTIVASGET